MQPGDAVDLLCCCYDDIDPGRWDHYLTLLDEGERLRYESLLRSGARRQFLLGRAMLRCALARRMNREPGELRFQRREDGKPELVSPAGGWRFNLSHSRHWVVLAVGQADEIGVDVEHHRRRNDIDGIAARFFSAEEYRELAKLPVAERRQRFFELWTLKEAYVKALGRGIATALAGTRFEYLAPDRATLHLSGAARCDRTVRCWHFRLDSDYSVAAVALGECGETVPRLYRWSPDRAAQPLSCLPTLTATG